MSNTKALQAVKAMAALLADMDIYNGENVVVGNDGEGRMFVDKQWLDNILEESNDMQDALRYAVTVPTERFIGKDLRNQWELELDHPRRRDLVNKAANKPVFAFAEVSHRYELVCQEDEDVCIDSVMDFAYGPDVRLMIPEGTSLKQLEFAVDAIMNKVKSNWQEVVGEINDTRNSTVDSISIPF